jgi:hypothetical protein
MPLYSCTFCCKRWVYSTPLNGRQKKAEIGYESEDNVVFEWDINDLWDNSKLILQFAYM